MSKLESLDAWKVARQLSVDAYRLTLERPLNRHFGLSDQIRRSAASIPANIAEGYGLGTRKQFIRMLRIALGSAFELKCHVELVIELSLSERDAAQNVVSGAERSVSVIIGLLKALGATSPK